MGEYTWQEAVDKLLQYVDTRIAALNAKDPSHDELHAFADRLKAEVKEMTW